MWRFFIGILRIGNGQGKYWTTYYLTRFIGQRNWA